MTDFATALILVGPTGAGPFHIPVWRISATIQLVEGSGNGPYWYFSPPSSSDGETWPSVLMIDSLEPHEIADSLLLALWSIADARSGNAELLEDGVVHSTNNGLRFARPWDRNAERLCEVGKSLGRRLRVGVVALSSDSAFTPATVKRVAGYGISVDVFGLQHV